MRELCESVMQDLQSKANLDKNAIYRLRFINHLSKHWKFICGPLLSPHIKPKGIRGHTLVLEATHSLWAEQARCYQDELLQRLKEQIPWLIVSQVRFETGTSQPLTNNTSPKPTPRPQTTDSFQPLNDAKNKLAKILDLLQLT